MYFKNYCYFQTIKFQIIKNVYVYKTFEPLYWFKKYVLLITKKLHDVKSRLHICYNEWKTCKCE